MEKYKHEYKKPRAYCYGAVPPPPFVDPEIYEKCRLDKCSQRARDSFFLDLEFGEEKTLVALVQRRAIELGLFKPPQARQSSADH